MFVPIEIVTFFAGVFIGVIGCLVFKDIFDDTIY